MQTLVIANGPLPRRSRYAAVLEQPCRVLCADGGADRAIEAGITPDFVIGDFDSLRGETRATMAAEKMIHRPSQYATDLEKTLAFALELGAASVVVLGVSGGRLDHQICNLNILEKFSGQMQISCIDEYGLGRIVGDRLSFRGELGQQVSLFAFGRAAGITTSGLKYPLTNATMEWAVSDGLSNEVIANEVEISVCEGRLFVYLVWPDIHIAEASR